MKSLITPLFLTLFTLISYSQKIKIDSTKFTIKHGDMTLYLDEDTNSYVSVHKISIKNIKKLDGIRSDKWHKENPIGPYKLKYYEGTGYDLGHLTPSNITSYDDTLNYHSFSLFNQSPQLGKFNRGEWMKLEKSVEDSIKKRKKNAVVVTGVIYGNIKKQYLNNSRIKVPILYYKILVFGKKDYICWIGDNSSSKVITTNLHTILTTALKNKNKLNIIIN